MVDKYSIPYLTTITALAVNQKMIPDVDYDWRLLFDDNLRNNFNKCGISVLDSPLDMFSIWLDYTGQSYENIPESKIKLFVEHFKKVKQNTKYLDSGLSYPDDLKNNKLCVSVVYLGNAIKSAQDNTDINLVIPDNRNIATIDAMVIPKTATNIDNAYVFINYMLQPEIAAKIVNATNHTSVVNNIKHLTEAKLQEINLLFPSRNEIRNFDLLQKPSTENYQLLNATWTN